MQRTTGPAPTPPPQPAYLRSPEHRAVKIVPGIITRRSGEPAGQGIE